MNQLLAFSTNRNELFLRSQSLVNSSTRAFSLGVNGDALSIVNCAVRPREQVISNVKKPLVDLSVDCVKWEPFPKLIRLLRLH